MAIKTIRKGPIVVGVALLGLSASIVPAVDALIAAYPPLAVHAPWLKGAANILAALIAVSGVVSLCIFPFVALHLRDHLKIARMWLGAKLLGAIDATVAFEVVVVAFTDLSDIRDFCVRTIGPGVSPIKKMKKWHQRNPNIFWKVIPKRGDDESSEGQSPPIHGYYGLIPLNKAAVDALNSEELDGVSFTTAHICAPQEADVAAFYIAGIAAEHSFAKRKVIKHLRDTIGLLVASGPRLFFTRPVSKEGLKLAHDFEFQRVDGHPTLALDELCRREISSQALAARIGR